MLVLAVIVTFFSVWNAVYLPSLKQQSEMTQLREVEGAFTRFSSDLTNAAALKRDLTFSEPLPLGGGGVILNSLLSGGTIRVNEEPLLLYTVNITDGDVKHEVAGRLVNFSYQPVNDFWVDQGYVWHYGYVNVTRGLSSQGADGAALSTPLSYATMEDMKKSGPIRKFAESLIEIEARPWYNSSANCTHISVSSVTFHPEPGASYVSSNGIGTFALAATVNETGYGVPEKTSPDKLVIRVSNLSVPDPFSLGLYNRCNQSFANLNATYPYNIEHTFRTTLWYNETAIAPVAGRLPFDITYRHIAINVSVH
ncbi:MAG: hypothetical protein Q7J09_07465 [Methanocalculus sp.]|uniref:hypothetical protein n=1 Tax=Methanocalculus sp. TaxID=2004547 RepID=UPI00272215A9|nr:hypothetical protein [Methanocalculus sp.]MDO9539823.1 hypothetical protein [Methanocalculus sp.]